MVRLKQRLVAIQRWKLSVITVLTTYLSSFPLTPTSAQIPPFLPCQMDSSAMVKHDRLLQLSLNGDSQAQKLYEASILQNAQRLSQCRRENWPKNLAIWLRLYPCDGTPGAIDRVLDDIVSRGYNQVYVEVFYSGQVLLPANDNPTPWLSVVKGTRNEQADLLAQIIAKGRARGLKVYAWVFTMNFGYIYGQLGDRQSVLARNGRNQTTLSIPSSPDDPHASGTQVFIDPYHPQARQDFRQLIQAIVQRQPDGILFDYVRYLRGQGTASIASEVKDLWIYGEAARQALSDRALNGKAFDLLQQFMGRGTVSNADIRATHKRYPREKSPLWRIPVMAKPLFSLNPSTSIPYQLWALTVTHGFQGILEFLNLATDIAKARGIASGVVFFPEGNQRIGQGFDSRLQFWENFPNTLEWHPMSYAICEDGRCIANQVQRVLSQAPPGTQVMPALAGAWGTTFAEHPPLELQMQALSQFRPQLDTVSHFAYSWQEPFRDRQRMLCQR
ncbi:MAG: family 10 glycosylhydrolase [Cyanobacteria bacterium LVE1205-1]|jgi:hypothetical protein